MSAGLLIFIITYLLISARRLDWLGLDRPGAAMAGAIACVATGALSSTQATQSVDADTLLLLFGVMGMGAFLAHDGFIERASLLMAQRAKTPQRLLTLIIWSSGILAALITNDAVCVLGAPLVVSLIKRHDLPPLPFLLALATASNTGSVATLVGNPQNMLCANLGQLSFLQYMLIASPIAVLSLALNHAIIAWGWRKALKADMPWTHEALAQQLWTPTSAITAATIILSVILYSLGAPMAWTAAGGTVSLLLLTRTQAHHIWAKIDWSLLLFFAGLFIVVEGLVHTGLPTQLFEQLTLWDNPWSAPSLFLIGSNLVSNVPFILVIKQQLAQAPDPQRAWTLLALCSTFAGNLTLLGSVANIIVAQAGKDVGGLGFWQHLRVGLPLALLSTLIATLWLNLLS